jgi:hypothetical protein
MNRTLIAKAKGPVAAHPNMATPFRAEAYGIASAASFINTMLRHFHDSADNHKWFILVDNDSVIRNLEKYATTAITSKWHLNPDADILESAAANLKKIPVNFIHVRSHQDTGRKSSKLSYDAQLNCMADELARQQNQTMTQPYTQRFPEFIHLKINDTIVTRDSKKWLREKASQIPIQHYYAEKYGWSTQVFNTIHWSAQQAVLSRYDVNDQRRILKFVHGWLPTYDRLHREKLSKSQRCPLCFYLVENNHHLFLCKHPSQQAISASMAERLRKDNQCSTRQELIHAIMEGITHGIKDSQWTAPAVYDNNKINKWITEQNQIGWSQLINGRLAQSLTQAISDILQSQGTESWYLSGEKWTRRLIQTFWDTMLLLWHNRNQILYEGNQVSRQERQRERLNQRVEKCFEDSNTLSAEDRDKLFYMDKKAILKEDPRKILPWLNLTERIIKVNKKEQARNTRERTLMEQYFKWHPPTQVKKRTSREKRNKYDLKPD